MQQQADQMPPEEAQEYLSKLQAGRAELAAEASPLEREMLGTLNESSKRMRELSTRKSDAEKQVEQLQQQVTGLGGAIAEVTGEMGGYARMLVSAEWSRRKAAKAAAEPQPEPEKAPEPVKDVPPGAKKAEPAPPAKPAKG